MGHALPLCSTMPAFTQHVEAIEQGMIVRHHLIAEYTKEQAYNQVSSTKVIHRQSLAIYGTLIDKEEER